MGPLGMGEIVVIALLALLIFGPKKLPELGKTFGKGMAEFKRASNELKSTFQREMDNIEHETGDVKSLATTVGNDINSSYYDDSEDDYYSGYDYGAGTSASESGTSGSDPAKADAGEKSESEAKEEGAAEPAAEDPPEVSGVPEAEEAAAPKPPA